MKVSITADEEYPIYSVDTEIDSAIGETMDIDETLINKYIDAYNVFFELLDELDKEVLKKRELDSEV